MKKIKLSGKNKILILVILILISLLLLYAFNPFSYITRERATVIYSHANDGYIYESDTDDSLSDAWNDVIDDDDGSVDNSGDIYIGSRTDGGNSTLYKAKIYRGFLFFDTTSVTGTVNTVSLRVYVEDVYESNDFDLVVQIDDDFTYPSNPLDNDDYDKSHYDGDYGSVDSDDIDDNDFLIITLDPDVINKGGWTKLCLRNSRDINDNRNTNDKKSYVVIASGDDDDTARYPALLINS